MRKFLLITIAVLGYILAEGTMVQVLPPCYLTCAEKVDDNHTEFDAIKCKMMQDYGNCTINFCKDYYWALVVRDKIVKLVEETGFPCEVNFLTL